MSKSFGSKPEEFFTKKLNEIVGYIFYTRIKSENTGKAYLVKSIIEYGGKNVKKVTIGINSDYFGDIHDIIESDPWNNKRELFQEGTALFEALINKINSRFLGTDLLEINIVNTIIGKMDLTKISYELSKIKIKDSYINKVVPNTNFTKIELEARYLEMYDIYGYRITFEDNFFKFCNNFTHSTITLDKCNFGKIEPFLNSVTSDLTFEGSLIIPTMTRYEDYYFVNTFNCLKKYESKNIEFKCRIKYKHGIYDEEIDKIVDMENLEGEVEKINKILSPNLEEDIGFEE